MLEVSSIRKGLVSFRPHNWPTLLLLTQQKPLSSMLEDDSWEITESRYRQMVNNGSIESMEVVEICSLKIRWSSLENIVRQISPIRFPRLKELHLNGNAICSIEALYYLDMRFLVVLNLKQNHIVSLRTLPKCILPTLAELMLFKNRISDFSPLQRLNAPKLAKLWSAPQKDSFDANQSSWIFKLQSNRLNQLFIKHERGQSFDFEAVESMSKQKWGEKVSLIYKIQDDIGIRRA